MVASLSETLREAASAPRLRSEMREASLLSRLARLPGNPEMVELYTAGFLVAEPRLVGEARNYFHQNLPAALDANDPFEVASAIHAGLWEAAFAVTKEEGIAVMKLADAIDPHPDPEEAEERADMDEVAERIFREAQDI